MSLFLIEEVSKFSEKVKGELTEKNFTNFKALQDDIIKLCMVCPPEFDLQGCFDKIRLIFDKDRAGKLKGRKIQFNSAKSHLSREMIKLNRLEKDLDKLKALLQEKEAGK